MSRLPDWARGVAGAGLALGLAGCSVPAGGQPAPAGTQAPATVAGDRYQAAGVDNTPGGPEPFEIEVTVQDGVVVDLTFTPQATNSESHRFQRIFARQIVGQVVGKSLAEARVERVSGASLTSDSFALAIADVEAQTADG